MREPLGHDRLNLFRYRRPSRPNVEPHYRPRVRDGQGSARLPSFVYARGNRAIARLPARPVGQSFLRRPTPKTESPWAALIGGVHPQEFLRRTLQTPVVGKLRRSPARDHSPLIHSVTGEVHPTA